MPSFRPNPHRLGGIAWLERTNGALTRAEKRRLAVATIRGQADAIRTRLALARGRRPPSGPELPQPPDSALAKAAEEAARDQSPEVIGHSYRTWASGRALASLDGERGLDEELFYVACLLHDAGLDAIVPGEDFTLRSGRRAAACAEGHRSPADVDHIRDAISAHTTPGATVEHDGAEAFYVQAGAVLDLGGLRLEAVSDEFVRAVDGLHPRTGVVPAIRCRIKAEAAAVPDGRFALLDRLGFALAVRISPTNR